MSWVEDARKKAQQEHDRRLQIFHQRLAKIKQEIEIVLEEGRAQDLVIHGAVGGFSFYKGLIDDKGVLLVMV